MRGQDEQIKRIGPLLTRLKIIGTVKFSLLIIFIILGKEVVYGLDFNINYFSSDNALSNKSYLKADFNYLPIMPIAGQEIKFFNYTSEKDVKFIWNFGDGRISQKKNPSHTYLKPAVYCVTLHVLKGDSKSQVSKTILVRNSLNNYYQSSIEQLKADFVYEPENPKVGTSVNFYDKSKGNPIKRIWQFGYFGFSLLANPERIFFAEGKYAVSLTVENQSESNQITKYIEVRPAPDNIIIAKSCSFNDVNEAIKKANPGDTVMVPAGTATWNNNLVISKGIILKGMGIGRTVITCNYTGDGSITSSSGYFITYEPSAPAEDQPFRLTGFTFNLNSKSGTGGLLLRNTSNFDQTKIRIDHTKWENVVTDGNIWWIYGYFWGVADNNYLDTPGRLRFYGLDDTTWANETFEFGSPNNFYMEDNFIRAHRDDYFYLEGAGRGAFRYNTIYCDVASQYFPIWELHGNQQDAWSSCMGAEIYENEVHTVNTRALYIRGGRTLAYNNQFYQTSGNVTAAASEQYADSLNPPSKAPDGQPQYISDTYVFNNYRNGTLLITDFPYTLEQLYYDDEDCYVPTEDRHFWKHNPSFDGSSGVGVGPLSKRPSICTKEGVAWWATDENKLYRWKNGRWELYYVPYTYPHPLRKNL